MLGSGLCCQYKIGNVSLIYMGKEKPAICPARDLYHQLGDEPVGGFCGHVSEIPYIGLQQGACRFAEG